MSSKLHCYRKGGNVTYAFAKSGRQYFAHRKALAKRLAAQLSQHFRAKKVLASLIYTADYYCFGVEYIYYGGKSLTEPFAC